MSNLESFTDVRTIASVSALVAVGFTSSYFLNEISEIKKQQAEMQQHLATLIPLVNPDVSQQINNTMKAVKLLDSRIAKTQDELKIMVSQSHDTIPDKEPPKKVYQRLTQRGGKRPATKVNSMTSPDGTDLDDDIKAMM